MKLIKNLSAVIVGKEKTPKLARKNSHQQKMLVTVFFRIPLFKTGKILLFNGAIRHPWNNVFLENEVDK